jgi:hypothetical protein
MNEMPEIRGQARRKPLGYDPETGRFVTIDDLESGRARLVSLRRLTDEQKKHLVIERVRVGQESVQMGFSGPKLDAERMVAEIEADTQFGRQQVEAELMYLEDLLSQIESALEARRKKGEP